MQTNAGLPNVKECAGVQIFKGFAELSLFTLVEKL